MGILSGISLEQFDEEIEPGRNWRRLILHSKVWSDFDEIMSITTSQHLGVLGERSVRGGARTFFSKGETFVLTDENGLSKNATGERPDFLANSTSTQVSSRLEQ